MRKETRVTSSNEPRKTRHWLSRCVDWSLPLEAQKQLTLPTPTPQTLASTTLRGGVLRQPEDANTLLG